MVTTSSVPAFLDALADTLAARADLVGVNVFSGPVSDTAAGKESIQLDSADGTQVGTAGNGGRSESYDASGLIYIVRATPPGQIEQSIRDCRDRAFAILAAIEDELRTNHTLNQTVRRAEITAYPFDQGAAPDGGRAARISFTIHVETWLSTT